MFEPGRGGEQQPAIDNSTRHQQHQPISTANPTELYSVFGRDDFNRLRNMFESGRGNEQQPAIDNSTRQQQHQPISSTYPNESYSMNVSWYMGFN